MTQKLTKMEIDRVDLVDAGANERRFVIFKRDAAAGAAVGQAWLEGVAAATTPAPSFLERIGSAVAKALGIGADGQPVTKAMTFAQQIAGREMSQALEENWWVLSDALWSAMWAVDDDGADLSIEAKQALVAQDLDEFKAYLLGVMQAGVGKRTAAPAPGILIEGLVAKVGRKISAARLTRLKEAASALTDVLNQVEASDDAATEKRAAAQEVDMTAEELQAAIAKGLEPLVTRITALEKAAAAPVAKADPAPDPAPDPDPDPDGDGVSLGAVATAIGKLADRLEKLEHAPGQPTAIAGQDGKVKKSSGWGSVFGIETH